MPTRDRLRHWLQGKRDPSPLPPATATSSVLSTTSAASPTGTSTKSNCTVGATTASASAVTLVAASRNQALQQAIEEHISTIPDREKDAFRSAAQKMTDDSILEQVHSDDQDHRSRSSFRRLSESISRTLNLLSRFTDAIVIGVQANPDISSIIVGAARGLISVAIGFVSFFDKLSEMISRMNDYLEPLTAYAKSAGDSKLVQNCLVKVYIDFLTLFRSARHIFVDDHGNTRKWLSWREFWRVQWVPFEEEFGKIEAEMRHHKDVLGDAARALTLEKSFEASQNEQARRQRELVKEREDFLRWLSNYPFEDVQKTTYEKKHPGTGDWLLRQSEFEQWFTKQDSAILWCYGKPGAGKSVLASNVIEHVSSKRALDDHVGIAFAYYSYQVKEMQENAFIISALIKQICRQNYRVPEGFLNVKRDALAPSQLGNVDSFLKAVEHYQLNEVFLVIDALDECPKVQRPAILKCLRDIVSCGTGHVKVFVTSRPEMDIEEAFKQMTIECIRIKARSVQSDINLYATEETRRLRQGSDGRKLNLNDPALEDQIIKTLTTKAEGMFLWVHLQLIHLCEESESGNDRDVERALATLPDGLDKTYERSLNQILQHDERRRRLAFQTLRWVMYAERPLTVKELQYALADEESSSGGCEPRTNDMRFLLSVCANLLEVITTHPTYPTEGTVRPIHYSVQEFITTTSDPRMQGQLLIAQHESGEIHTALATTCMTYLMSNLTGLAPCGEYYKLEQRFEECPFLWYAARSFDYHLAQSTHGAALIALAKSLLQQPSKFLASVLQARATVDNTMVIFSSRLYDMVEFHSYWKGRQLNPLLLHAACSAGLTQAVEHLLEVGIMPNSADDNRINAIYFAAISGQIEIMRLLLDAGAEIDAQGGYYGNALQAALVEGHEQMVRLLIEKGANVDAQGGRYSNDPMGANVNAHGGVYSNALQAALLGGHEQIVRLLIEKKADVDAQGGYYGNALQAAAHMGHEQIVRLLIEKGANVDAQGGWYGNALQAASCEGHEQIVKILLDAGAQEAGED
ncbi:hypothetical protein EPUS_04659 [Endocarpon pusillum Z07020]|uniref:Uncharacterized protein n=1 Tax=Endocarpon pusillum (strain Z07020 / HMAS-L-300199) TaxID=1263415 RepID=U1GA53_ENDPU|nr:uncharacterized protein EPUS_04659 [Endocarpon pusillum Z07020]ERF68561.1 hypothetical protein EPUS_04659 [Endocarpon pusillum Z07020]